MCYPHLELQKNACWVLHLMGRNICADRTLKGIFREAACWHCPLKLGFWLANWSVRQCCSNQIFTWNETKNTTFVHFDTINVSWKFIFVAACVFLTKRRSRIISFSVCYVYHFFTPETFFIVFKWVIPTYALK